MRDVILKAYKFKNRKKGAKLIKMTLQDHFDTNFNLKRIRRIMKKFDIFFPVRKANPYRRMMKATQEHRVVSNKLKRKFRQNMPGKVLLTDITYLFYGKGKKAYLSTILDAATNETLAYNLSPYMKLDLAIDSIHKLKKNRKINIHKDV